MLQNDHLAVVNGRDIRAGSVKASPASSGVGRQRSAKQNHSSPTLENFHLDLGDFVPVNSKKCDAGTIQRSGPLQQA